MLQEIAPHIFHNEFINPPPRPADRVAVFAEGSVLLTRDGGFPTVAELTALGTAAEELVRLFSVDDTSYFLLWQVTDAVRAALIIAPRSALRTLRPPEACMAGATAAHLADWYASSRFCGRCGAPARRDDKERAMRCTACGSIVYPRINPAVVTAVRDGDRVLAARYADRAMTYRYALIAGFVEIGETLEDTVRREVREETGLRVRNIRYHASQPWGFVGNLMVGFWCELDGSDAVSLDDHELSEAVWLHRDQVPETENPIDLTHTMLNLFRAGKDPR
jgi:NAD+ diphosphatase